MKSDKREHHNLLERRRRDHIKESFYDLRDCLPQLRGEKVCTAVLLVMAILCYVYIYSVCINVSLYCIICYMHVN